MPRYPGDMLGYGAGTPDPGWHAGAKVAVHFVLNYEEGGENCVLHGDAASEAFISEIVGAQPWPGQRHWNMESMMESMYDYGAREDERADLLEAMSKDAFVDAYGGVFEHSPWVAERAFELELGPAHDCAAGVHNALCRAFRKADKRQRLEVLRAHPDLAGKLAAAKRLTPESTAEQAGAGLDLLTDEERTEFTGLNDAYTRKFGFPFIIAVRDHHKAGILDAFRRRLSNDSDREFAEACRQVERIARLRLGDMLP